MTFKIKGWLKCFMVLILLGADVAMAEPSMLRLPCIFSDNLDTFDYVGAGLMIGQQKPLQPVLEVKKGTLKQFTLAGQDRQWHCGQARIEGDQIVVSSRRVPKPVAVRYGFTMNPLFCNFYNPNGLPASPFRTDNWFIGWGAY